LAGAIWPSQSVGWRVTLISLTFHWVLVAARYWNVSLVAPTDICGLQIDTLGISLHSLPAVVLLVPTYRDWQLRRRRDCYHWLGVFTLWATVLLSWPSLFWYMAIYG
jgi:hypothetical protein